MERVNRPATEKWQRSRPQDADVDRGGGTWGVRSEIGQAKKFTHNGGLRAMVQTKII
jgi:hypothetical protein